MNIRKMNVAGIILLMIFFIPFKNLISEEWKNLGSIIGLDVIELNQKFWVSGYQLNSFDSEFVQNTFSMSNSGLINDYILSLEADKDYVWICTIQGICKLNKSTYEINIDEELNNKLPDIFVWDILIKNDVKWIASYGGLLKITNDKYDYFNKSNSIFTSDSLRKIFLDSKNRIWFGAIESSNIVMYDGTDWKSFEKEDIGFDDFEIFDITEDKDGIIWFAMRSGNLLKYDSESWEMITSEELGLPQTRMVSLSVDTSNKLWFATKDQGFGYIDGTQIKIFNTNNSDLVNNECFKIYIDKYDNKWVCSKTNLQIYNEDKIVTNVDELPKDYKYKIYPNPTSSYLVIDGQGEVEISLIALNGQELIAKDYILGEKLDLSGIFSGVYFLKIIKKGDISIQKIIVFN
jgi:type IX secretion system substrate protein